MSLTVPISELKQRTGKILSKVVLERQDVIIERYGEEYAVILSRERYQQLIDAAQARIRERFLAAQEEIYAVTAAIPADEIDQMIESAITESRQARAK